MTPSSQEMGSPGNPGRFNPQSWNRYSYVRNNPVNGVDADGEFTRQLHAEITGRVLSDLGVGRSEILSVISANVRQDALLGGRANWHAHATGWVDDTGQIRTNAKEYAHGQLQKAIKAASAGHMNRALKHLGKGLHTVQDLVAHEAFPNLSDNMQLLGEHAWNDFEPTVDELDRATQDSANYVKEFQEQTGGALNGLQPQNTNPTSVSTTEPSAKWYSKRAYPGDAFGGSK